MRHYLTPVRIAISNKFTNDKCQARMWREENPCALLVGMQIGAATMENRMEVLQIIKTELPYNSAISLLGV